MRVFSLVFVLHVCLLLPCLGQSVATAQQSGRKCGTTEYLEILKQQDPSLIQKQQKLEQAVQHALQQKPQGKHLRQAAITIPVVFHVVYSNEEENISDEQLLSQLAVLNADFRRLNADAANTPSYFQALAADAEIEFCLAITDPAGNPTTGITRTQSSQSSFSYARDNVKSVSQGGAEVWNRDQYLNIWVCNLETGILGYATHPSASAASDGIVLHYESVGAYPANPFPAPYNLGRTATHEVGHWLGLKHIWGNGSRCSDSDDIDDTPNQLEGTAACPDSIVISCDNGPYGNMWQNYMDYSDDGCMNLFTRGQVNYMQAVLEANRPSIINSIVCSNDLRSDFRLTSAADSLVAAGSTIQFKDSSQGARPTSWLWAFEGGVPATSTEQHPKVTYAKPGQFKVTLNISNGAVSDTKVKEAFVNVTVSNLTVYPVPASDYITIEQPALIQVREIELVNRLGQTLSSATVRDRVIRMDIGHLPAGIYFLRIRSSNGLEIKKISVVR